MKLLFGNENELLPLAARRTRLELIYVWMSLLCSQPKNSFVLEGGSIHVDGEGTVLTTEGAQNSLARFALLCFAWNSFNCGLITTCVSCVERIGVLLSLCVPFARVPAEPQPQPHHGQGQDRGAPHGLPQCHEGHHLFPSVVHARREILARRPSFRTELFTSS